MKKVFLHAVCSLSLLSASLLSGQAIAASFNFLAGSYAGNYDSQGIPNALDPADRKKYSDDFWTKLSASLPEKTDLRTRNPGSISSDEMSNLHLKEEGDVSVTFLHEGAGYRNSFGFFTYDPANPPQSISELMPTIVFPNTSFANSGGSARGLTSGDTLYLGRFKAGTNIGFVVMSNGFDPTTGVKNNQDPKLIFTTLRHLNSEVNEALRPHTVMLYDDETQQAVLGLEDMLRTDFGCDHDFNDIIFTLSANPPTAIDTSALKPLPEAVDSDGDGVLDANDSFPNDPQKAFYQYYPEQGQVSTLAFEDNWPSQGDYDMNDLVVNYAYEHITSANGSIKALNAKFELIARGADLHNSFALEIPGVDPANIESASLNIGGKAVKIQAESGQKYAVFNLIDDASNYLPAGAGKCRFYNTLSECPARPGQSFELNVSLKSPIAKTIMGLPPYNPFIYRKDQRGFEIHLPNHPPTDKASKQLFGSKDDASSAMQKQYYKTKANLPWALDIPTQWYYPKEQSEISSAYLDFKPWAESQGTQKSDWYRQNSQDKLIFGK